MLILGGGFGGLYAARALRRAPLDITLLDRRNYHLFQPLIYQVATGSLSPGEIAAPLRAILSHQKNARVLLGEAVDIDPAAKRVILADGGRFSYDALIVATGAQTSYFGNDHWRAWAPSLKSIEEATAIRHKILYAFEAAERATQSDERNAWLTFVIVGAGATGLEVAGALAAIAQETLRHDFRSICPEEARILVLDGAPRVLASFPEDLSRKAQHALEKLRVEFRFGAMVRHIDGAGVTLETSAGKEQLAARTVIWGGGVSASAFARKLAARANAPTDGAGRIRVNADLTVPGFPDIYVIGDIALASGANGKPLPGVAQVAMQQGGYAAKAIVARHSGPKDLPPFRYLDKGDLAVLGRGRAVANIFGLHLSGFPAWLVWLFVHLMYIVQFQSRVLIFVQWAFEYLTFNRGARLITGITASDYRAAQEDGPATPQAPPP